MSRSERVMSSSLYTSISCGLRTRYLTDLHWWSLATSLSWDQTTALMFPSVMDLECMTCSNLALILACSIISITSVDADRFDFEKRTSCCTCVVRVVVCFHSCRCVGRQLAHDHASVVYPYTRLNQYNLTWLYLCVDRQASSLGMAAHRHDWSQSSNLEDWISYCFGTDHSGLDSVLTPAAAAECLSDFHLHCLFRFNSSPRSIMSICHLLGLYAWHTWSTACHRSLEAAADFWQISWLSASSLWLWLPLHYFADLDLCFPFSFPWPACNFHFSPRRQSWATFWDIQSHSGRPVKFSQRGADGAKGFVAN